MTRGTSLLVLMFSLGACSTSEPPTDKEARLASSALLPPGLRRLSVAELSAAASVLVGGEVDLSTMLPPDARQNDFSRSLTQSVDALTLKQLDAAARALAERLDSATPSLPECAKGAATDDAACRAEVVAELATRAFRRSATSTELSSLTAIFDAGATDATFRDGVALVLRALLGSPAVLYEAALGSPSAASGTVSLSDDELASQLAWLVSGRPPDAELRRAATAGELRSRGGRQQQALRLLHDPASRFLYRRFIEEWLGLNRLQSLAKSSAVVTDFAQLREPMLRETEAVIDDSLSSTGGSLAQLFAGGYSLVPSELAALYGIAAPANSSEPR
jgi:hypothetical protein